MVAPYGCARHHTQAAPCADASRIPWRHTLQVLLGGGSAGALSSYLHANYVQAAWLPSSVRKFKLMPASGFFLNATNTLSTRVYGDAITYMGNMMNSSYGVNADCIGATPSNEWCGWQWLGPTC